jgi:LmbE family N-acetylglucosaminyl deacetylase
VADRLGTRSQERVAACWLDFVNRFVEAFEVGRTLPTAQLPYQPLQPREQIARRKAILCSPHPDDEALVGGLALRLRLEAGVEVLNCAITLGSSRDDRKRRLAEVESSCRILNFRLLVLNDANGFEDVKPDFRKSRKRAWQKNVESLAQVFDSEEPGLVFLPHADDYHATHIGTHYFALDALRVHLDRSHHSGILVVETEFWHAMTEPNLMVGLSPMTLAHLVMATAEHGGEVMRNPYHVTLPARLMDNVRRGSEILGRFGKEASPFLFAELYRLSTMSSGERNCCVGAAGYRL